MMKKTKKVLGIIAIIAMIGIIAIACDNGSATTTDPCAKGHAFPEWTAPTCEAAGNSERTCTRSGCTVTDTRTEGFAKLDHDWEYDPDAVPPTCITEGKGHRHCKNCPADEESGTFPKLDHKWEWDVTEPPNCVFAGVKVRVCEDCETEETDVVGIEKDEHDIGGNNPPTCLLPGSGTIFCKRDNCGYTVTLENIEPRGHHFVEHWDEVTAATCIAQGLEERFCTHDFCDKIEDPNDAENHYRQTKSIAINPDNHAVGCDPSTNYVITGSGTAFSVNDRLCIPANQTIANTLIAIRTHADGAAVTIQFGNGGTNRLNISDAIATFNNSGGTWGLITLTGRIITDNGTVTVQLADNVSINSTGEIMHNTGNTYNHAISNGGTGTVTISGGTVSARTGAAINNTGAGKIIITGGTVTSTNVTASSGTISNTGAGSIEISGGTISNTGNNPDANAIRNSANANAAVTLRNCAVQSTYGYAIRNAGLHNRINMDNSVETQGRRLLGSDHDSSVPAANCESSQICANEFCDYVIKLAGHDFTSFALADSNIEDLTTIAVNGNCSICGDINVNLTLAQYIIAALQEGTADDPVPLQVSINLGAMGTADNGWTRLRTALDSGGKFVALDLSGSTRSPNGAFTTGSAQYTTAPGMNRIVSIVLPTTSVTSIGNYAFNGCSGLTSIGGTGSGASIEIPNSVTSIGYAAFSPCSGLTSVTIPVSVTRIDSSAFNDCTNLRSVTFERADTTIGNDDYVFPNGTSLYTAYITNGGGIGTYIRTGTVWAKQ